MVPLGSLLRRIRTFGPDVAQRYNAYRSADINGGPAPGFSSGQAQAAMAQILDATLPRGMSFEWTDLAYQQLISGNTATIVFPLCVLFVFLVLAAQYESLTLPLAIILIVPMCLLAAITGVLLDHGDNNVFMQIGLLVLVGLACKNAILIVEFAQAPAGGARPGCIVGRARGRAPAPAADPHDLLRLHHGCGAAGARAGRRRRSPPRDGRHGLRRHARA